MVRDPAIADYLVKQPDLGRVARTLVDQANQNGGADNITVILVRVI
jgi:PPM family protein phosphatase